MVRNLNTPRQVYDEQQQLRWRWEQQEAFGVNAPDENPSSLGTFDFPLRYPGQYADKETNLHYNYFRDYDPNLGIYKQSDPVDQRDGRNKYTYVGADPLAAIDPFGDVEWKGTFGGFAGIKGVGAGFFRFDLVSECKCKKRVRIKGVVSTLAIGLGYKTNLGGSISKTEFYDYNSCPDPNVANGFTSIASAALVPGVGFTCSKVTLGHLYQAASCSGPAVGLDASIGVYFGASMVTDRSEECCDSN